MCYSAFFDQFAKHQSIYCICNTVINSLPDILCHTYITSVAGSVILNPRADRSLQTTFQYTKNITY